MPKGFKKIVNKLKKIVKSFVVSAVFSFLLEENIVV